MSKAESKASEMVIETVKISDRTLAVLAEQIKNLSGANKTADSVDEAFAKTRVMLQAAASSTDTSSDISAVSDLKEYISNGSEQRSQANTLKELAIDSLYASV